MNVTVKFDTETMRAWVQAKYICSKIGMPVLPCEPLVTGLLTTGPNAVTKNLHGAKVDIHELLRALMHVMQAQSTNQSLASSTCALVQINEELKQVLKTAKQFATEAHSDCITSWQILKALYVTSDGVRAVLEQHGVRGKLFGKMQPPSGPVIIGPQTIVVAFHTPTQHSVNGNPCWCWRERFRPKPDLPFDE